MKHKKILLLFFTLLLFIPSVFLVPSLLCANEDAKQSSIEAPSIESVTARDYQTQWDNMLRENFIGASFLHSAKTRLDILFGKKESNGIFILDDSLIQKSQLPKETITQTMLDQINQLSDATGTQSYLMLIPSAAEVNQKDLPIYAPKQNEVEWINSCYANLGSNITGLDAVTAIKSAPNESEVYYKTDPRLTSAGVFTLYSSMMKTIGFVPASRADFNIEYAINDFYGSLYQQLVYRGAKPDRVSLYHYNKKKIQTCVTKQIGANITTDDSLYDRDYLNSQDSASVFSGDPCPITKISTNSGTGKKILIFGDQNADTFSQFLFLHYDEIAIINLDYLTKSYTDLITLSDYDTILYIYNVASLSETDHFKKLQYFLY